MTSSTVDQLVDHYLSRLADAAHGLPPDRRAELLSEIQEHIAASRANAPGADEAAVKTMLDRLGEPADIVAAAVEDGPPGHPADAGRTQGRRSARARIPPDHRLPWRSAPAPRFRRCL